MKLHRYISGLLIAAIATASLATKIEVSQINGFNEAVQQQITLYGVPVTRSINSGAGLTGGGDLSANRTLAIDYTHTGTWSGPQTFSGGLSGALTGNASTASHLATSRTFSYTGDATGGPTSFDGSANISTALALASVGTAGTYGDATHVPQFTTDAKGRVTGVTAVAISGIPASSAVKLTTARNFSITGDVATSSACSFDGTADCTLNVAMASTVAGAHTFSGALTASGGVTGNLTGNVTGNVSGLAGTATALANPQTIGTLTGDATSAGSAFDGTASNANALTFATVNSNVGSFGDATHVAAVTVNAKGLVTAASAVSISGVPASTANTLTTPRLIGTITGDVTATGSNFDGSAANANAATLATVLVTTPGSYGSTTTVPVITVNGKGLVTAAAGASIAFPSSISGNAATATALQTARTIATQTGDVTSPGASFNGTANETAATTLVTTQTGAHTWSSQNDFNSGITAAFVSPTGDVNSGFLFPGSGEVDFYSGGVAYGYFDSTAKWYFLKTINAGSTDVIDTSGYHLIKITTTAGLPSAASSTGRLAAVSDPVSGQSPLRYSNGSSWTTVAVWNQPTGMTLITTDAGATLTLVQGVSTRQQNLTAVITANRTVTLPASGSTGSSFHFTRDVLSTGVFNWAIGALKNLAAGQWCDVTWSGSAWKLTAFGSL